jgi:Ca2+-binding RTX toxin-like protein
LTVNNTNDAPTSTPIDNDFIVLGTGKGELDTTAFFNDVDQGDTLTYTLEEGAAWASIDPVTGLLSGTPEPGDVGTDTYTVRATDGSGELAEESFDIEVIEPTAVNGTAAADTLTGTADHEILTGLEGADTLDGGDGEDILDGGIGDDTLTGGADSDVFVYRYDSTVTPTNDPNWDHVDGFDTILDFSVDDGDKLHLIDINGELNSLADLETAYNDQRIEVILTGAGINILAGSHVGNPVIGETGLSGIVIQGITTPINNFDDFVNALGGEDAFIFG